MRNVMVMATDLSNSGRDRTMKQLKNAVLIVLLAVGVTLGLVPVTAAPANAEGTSYDLWVGGTQVTSENASDILGNGKASYNASTNTLTLNGAEITNSYTYRRFPAEDIRMQVSIPKKSI